VSLGELSVQWGLVHRELQGVESIGVGEIHWGHGLRADNSLTVILTRSTYIAGAVKDLNNKIRVVTRRSYRFRPYNAMEMEWPSITRWNGFPSQNQPTNSAEGAEKEP
jgi:hypothetical protein